jgi:hypothetical protein
LDGWQQALASLAVALAFEAEGSLCGITICQLLKTLSNGFVLKIICHFDQKLPSEASEYVVKNSSIFGLMVKKRKA